MPILPTDVPEPTLRLLLARGIGPVLLARLRSRFGDDAAIVRLRCRDLESIEGVGRTRAAALHAELAHLNTRSERAAMRDANAGLVLLGSGEYPPLLARLPLAPPALWVSGELFAGGDPSTNTVAVVGARRCSPYGLAQAARFAGALAECGLTIVSGGAIGIDAEAHRAALRAGGHTVAVLGSGLARPHPRGHVKLFRSMVDAGSAVISEFSMTTEPRPALFPRRNRIISGMSRGVVVIEAGLRSGALLTASCAVESHGRDAMVVPGPVDAPESAGCNAALRDAWAAPVLEPVHVVEQLGGVGCATAVRAEAAATSDPAEPASAQGRALLDQLAPDGTGIDVDALAAALRLSVGSCLVEITRLELLGLVARTPGLVHRRRGPTGAAGASENPSGPRLGESVHLCGSGDHVSTPPSRVAVVIAACVSHRPCEGARCAGGPGPLEDWRP